MNVMIGTYMFSRDDNYVVNGMEKRNAEFQAKCQRKLDIDVDALRAKMQDGVEIKGLSRIEMTSENYNNILKVKGMPRSIFGDSFGYGMQKEIAGCMKDYYAGNINEQDVKKFFNGCCSSMRIYCSQQRMTNGKNEADNTQIVSQMYEMFAKENQRAARNANSAEGMKINNSLENSGRKDDWCYYNADYYYQCESMRGTLQGAVNEMAEKWNLAEIDCNEVEKSSKFTLDGEFDFNSGWNFEYRNQVSRSSMENEEAITPEGFKFFYKESYDGDKGFMKVWYGDSEKTVDVPFHINRDSLKGQIFNASELLTFSEKDTNKYEEYNSFLNNISVFTRWYSWESGINNKFGNYVPRYE